MRTYFLFSFFTTFFIRIETKAQSFSLQSVTGYPFISEIAAAGHSDKVAFAINEKGKRNIYTAQGPAFGLNKITSYDKDEGIEITSVSVSTDGKWIVYVRGGDHGAFDESITRNPSSLVESPSIEIFCMPFSGGQPVLIGEGDHPVIDLESKNIVFIKKGQVWKAPCDGASPAQPLFITKGNISDLQFSPNGSKILFVCSRGDHSFIGLYENDSDHIEWIAPGFARDQSPRWSPDGRNIVFVRRPASERTPDSLTVQRHLPWSLWLANVGSQHAKQIWKAPTTLAGSVPASQGRYNLHWAAGGRIIFLSYQDGWPHLYSLPIAGGEPVLLTPGPFNVEQIRLSPDRKWLVFAANMGPAEEDRDRRHIVKVLVDQPKMEILTAGTGIESTPLFINNGNDIVFLSAAAQRPSLPAMMPFVKAPFTLLGKNLVPANFPVKDLLVPKSVRFKAADGTMVYGQLFQSKSNMSKRPAILFIHGGPQRQMLLGWHYMDYYANTYALNQYLANSGFVVLSVNYRLGVGYGYKFQNPESSGRNGASEYQDIKAAGEWLASRPGIDASRIGVYGGSYGGYLTAMALARDSKLFAAGADISGMHNLVDAPAAGAEPAPDEELARKLMWQSSPSAYVDAWTSPVLIITGDDDGNVPFYQSVDIVRRFEKKRFPFESMVFPDETHHWMKYANTLQMDSAVAEFLTRKLINRE